MSSSSLISRRRLIKTLFCSSVAMRMNLAHAEDAEKAIAAKAVSSLDFLALGDFGSGTDTQRQVARAMVGYAKSLAKPTNGLLLLGDNFYGPMPGGVKSPRWVSGFSEPYPAHTFPNPCWAVLGNHDYQDTAGNEIAQLRFNAFRKGKTRWRMPAKYYRLDLPVQNPQITFLMIDTNWQAIQQRVHGPGSRSMSADEQAKQQVWLEKQLRSRRAPFTVVIGHHPVYSDASHGDTPELVQTLGPLLEKHGVHLYLGGHDHDLQHLELDGLRTSFVVSGGGGAPLYKHKELRKGSTVIDTNGFSHLSLRRQRLHLSHIDTTGKVVHTFSKGVNHDWKIETS